MSFAGKTDGQVYRRYLSLLGVTARKPSREALDELVSAHLTRIPFENVSKIYSQKRFGLRYIPPLEQYLDGIERYHFGGTCFTNNFYMFQLLSYLGYQIKLCAADIARNGAPPNGHMLSMVTVEGMEVIVDVGYGAPFLHPLPRELDEDYVIAVGRDRYVLKPKSPDGFSRLELYRSGELKHGYLAKPEARQIDQFKEVIERSYDSAAPFLNTLLLARFSLAGMLAIHNFLVVESTGLEHRVHNLSSREEIVAAVHEHFKMPVDIVSEVVSGLSELRNLWA